MQRDERTERILAHAKHHPEVIAQVAPETVEAAERNCENRIGAVAVPVGVAGPLHLRTEERDAQVVVPFATTEAALVASVNRGMKAIRESGGAWVSAEHVGMTRAPVVRAGSTMTLDEAEAWVHGHLSEMQAVCADVSSHLQLLQVNTYQDGEYLFFQFFFDTDDAMGMNMVTYGSRHILQEVIIPATGVELVALSGNVCCDKKPAQITCDIGRGYRVTASVDISATVVEQVLKTTPQQILKVVDAKLVSGARVAGTLGSNCHIANIAAAVYLATGQDLAHVVESAHGTTTATEIADGVRIAVTMPAVVCGVVGGGTGLPGQKDALQLLGLSPDPEYPGRAKQQFAETIAAAALAGEVSLLAALASDQLAQAHASLSGRTS